MKDLLFCSPAVALYAVVVFCFSIGFVLGDRCMNNFEALNFAGPVFLLFGVVLVAACVLDEIQNNDINNYFND